MKFFSFLVSASLAAGVVATPTPTLQERAPTWCDAFGSLATEGYTVYHNNWGAGQATSGSQCTTFNSVKNKSFSWSTTWSWQGGNIHVKSYSNVALEKVNKKLSAISSIPSTWTWKYVYEYPHSGLGHIY